MQSVQPGQDQSEHSKCSSIVLLHSPMDHYLVTFSGYFFLNVKMQTIIFNAALHAVLTFYI